jgi:hypothetical protein
MNGRADTEQQHAIGRLQCTHPPPVLLQHQPRSASRSDRVERVEVASSGEPSAPSHKYAAAQSAASIPCSAASNSPILTIVPIKIATPCHKPRLPRLSCRVWILRCTNAMNTTHTACIVRVSAMSAKLPVLSQSRRQDRTYFNIESSAGFPTLGSSRP